MITERTAFKPIPADRSITPEGYPFIITGLVVAVLAAFLGWFYISFLFIVITLFVCYFFRNPKRVTSNDEAVISAPADGKIIAIDRIDHHPIINGPARKISIFMSVFNCHVNRIPIHGSVDKVIYDPGKFFVASLDKASDLNERNTVVLKDASDRSVVIVQIAGIIARRIICYLKEGLKAVKGSRLGVICFGSRVDIYLPEDSFILEAKKGDPTRAGETIIGRWK